MTLLRNPKAECERELSRLWDFIEVSPLQLAVAAERLSLQGEHTLLAVGVRTCAGFLPPFLQPATCYLLPATCYLLPATCRLPRPLSCGQNQIRGIRRRHHPHLRRRMVPAVLMPTWLQSLSRVLRLLAEAEAAVMAVAVLPARMHRPILGQCATNNVCMSRICSRGLSLKGEAKLSRAASSQCGRLLLSISADLRSADDVIAFEGRIPGGSSCQTCANRSKPAGSSLICERCWQSGCLSLSTERANSIQARKGSRSTARLPKGLRQTVQSTRWSARSGRAFAESPATPTANISTSALPILAYIAYNRLRRC